VFFIDKARRHAARLLGAAAIAIGCSGAAQAIVYTGSWDPAFGSAFPSLGWGGQVAAFVPDACLAQSGLVLNSAACSGNGMQLLSAQVRFYDLAAPATTLETLTFATAAGGSAVTGMFISGGALTGIVGNFNYLVPATQPIAGGGSTLFGLGFVGSNAYMTWFDTVSLMSGLSDPQFPATVTFTPAIPEPATTALMLAGLLALALMGPRLRARPQSS
jgi:hypothetical protein